MMGNGMPRILLGLESIGICWCHHAWRTILARERLVCGFGGISPLRQKYFRSTRFPMRTNCWLTVGFLAAWIGVWLTPHRRSYS
jgi:hypothetical protein